MGEASAQTSRRVTPKIKSPATIGVASGFSISETLKKLTNNLMTKEAAANVSSSFDQTSGDTSGGPSRRRSVTRIISSDSLKNLKTFKSGSSSSSANPQPNTDIYSPR